MTSQIVGRFHMGIGLDYSIDLILNERSEGKTISEFTNPPNQNINEVLSLLFDLKSKGFEQWPMCDHYDSKGACLGHKS